MMVIMKTLAVQRDRIRAAGLSRDEAGRLVLTLDVEGRLMTVGDEDEAEVRWLYAHVVGECNGLDKGMKAELAKACEGEV